MGTKPVEITFGKDVPAYANVIVQMPSDMPLEVFLREQAGDLMGNLVFSPDWQQSSAERAVLATTDGEEIQDFHLNGPEQPEAPADRLAVLRREIEDRIKELRRLSQDPFEVTVTEHVAIEIRPEGEGDKIIVAKQDSGYTVVNYGSDGLKVTIYDESPAWDPIHELEIEQHQLVEENAGTPALLSDD